MTPDLTGKTLDKYHILEEIGQGGMGVVYKARDTVLDRLVAVKVLDPHFTRDQEFVQRFLREARAAAGFRHAHIAAVYDIEQAGGYHFIVMEYLDGRPLSDVIRQRGALSPKDTAHIVGQIGRALDYAHARGVVHRDVKPSNVIVSSKGHATLTDFGVAKAAAETKLTQTGTLLGTPAYMAPEQIKGEPVGPASDVYSLGVVTYEMLGGRPPFEGDTHRLLYAHVHEEPPPLSQIKRQIPRAVGAVVQKAMAKEPRARWASAGTFAAALRKAVRSGKAAGAETVGSRRRRWLLRALGGLGAVLLVLAMAFGARGILNGTGEATATPTPSGEPGPIVTPGPTSTLRPTNTIVPSVTPSPRPPATATQTPTRRPTATRTRRPPTATPRPSPKAVVTTDRLNLRAGPDTAHPIVDTLRQGTSLDVVARTPDSQWLEVATLGGTRGWVFGDLVTLNVSVQSIIVAARTPTPPVPTPTSPPVATAPPPTEPPPTQQYPAPKLVGPPNAWSVQPVNDVTLLWGWPERNQCGPLAPDEYFDVRVWEGGQAHTGVAWVKQCQYSLDDFLRKHTEETTFHWAVAVVRVQNGQWIRDLSPESESRSIGWNPQQ